MRLYEKWNIAQDKSYDSLVEALLASRDMVRSDLEVGHESLHDPMLLRDMDRAVYRIIRAVRSAEMILVFGD